MPDDSRAIVEGKTKYENFYVHILQIMAPIVSDFFCEQIAVQWIVLLVLRHAFFGQ